MFTEREYAGSDYWPWDLLHDSLSLSKVWCGESVAFPFSSFNRSLSLISAQILMIPNLLSILEIAFRFPSRLPPSSMSQETTLFLRQRFELDSFRSGNSLINYATLAICLIKISRWNDNLIPSSLNFYSSSPTSIPSHWKSGTITPILLIQLSHAQESLIHETYLKKSILHIYIYIKTLDSSFSPFQIFPLSQRLLSNLINL